MPKSSSADAGRLAFRAAAVLFAATTIFITVLFIRALVVHNEIRSGLLTYGLFTGAATVGLWMRRRWGRGLALLIAMGNMGLGTLALLSVILLRQGSATGPAILLVSSIVLGYVLSRSFFSLPDE